MSSYNLEPITAVAWGIAHEDLFCLFGNFYHRTGKEILCRKRQSVGLHSVKHISNGRKGKEINVRLHREVDNTGVELHRFYCILSNITSFLILHTKQ